MSPMVETVFAGMGAAVCVGLLVHMFLPAPTRQRVDAACRRLWQGARAAFSRRGGKPRPVRRPGWRAANDRRKSDPQVQAEVQREAEREAQDVIERARRQARADQGVQREGNVYRPDAFKPRPPEDKLH
jgi:hypothetical protein